MAELLLLS